MLHRCYNVARVTTQGRISSDTVGTIPEEYSIENTTMVFGLGSRMSVPVVQKDQIILLLQMSEGPDTHTWLPSDNAHFCN